MPVLHIRSTTTAHQIADIHKHLGDAYLALHRAAVAPPGLKSPLATVSQDALVRAAKGLQMAAFSLESEFIERTNPDAPFANVLKPNHWREWLDAAGAP